MGLALDGSVLFGGSNTTSISGNLTTAHAGDVIVLFVETNGAASPSANTVTDTAGLTWTVRTHSQSGDYELVEYWAIAGAALSADTITVQNGSDQFLGAIAFGISGADTASPYDSNAALPAVVTSGTSVTVSTLNANDFIFVGVRAGRASPGNMSAPWTTIQSGDWMVAGYQIVSTTQSGLAIPFPGGSTNGAIGDAIVAGAAAGPYPYRRQRTYIGR